MADTCPKCDRTFVLLSTYVRHVNVVHGAHDSAWYLPKIVVTTESKEVMTVPFGKQRTRAKPELINPDAPGECGECPTDGYLLPAHPNCQCKPKEGWDKFLKAAEEDRPDNWTVKEWADHLKRLRKEKIDKHRGK